MKFDILGECPGRTTRFQSHVLPQVGRTSTSYDIDSETKRHFTISPNICQGYFPALYHVEKKFVKTILYLVIRILRLT